MSFAGAQCPMAEGLKRKWPLGTPDELLSRRIRGKMSVTEVEATSSARTPLVKAASKALAPGGYDDSTILPCREEQHNQLMSHLSSAIRHKGSKKVLYVSGMPGTGKTASVLQVVSAMQKTKGLRRFVFVHVNAMCLGRPLAVYGEIWRQLQRAGLTPPGRVSAAAAAKEVEHFFVHRAERDPVILLLIDEVDCLATRSQAILYRILSLITLPRPQLVMVTISNSIDLPERLLPKVCTRLGFDRVDFRSYTREQIHHILQQRLESHKAMQVFKNDALKYCAARVAGHSGDVRKALQLCRRALELCCERSRTSDILVGLDSLRAADEDLLQSNPCIFAIRHIGVKSRLFLLSFLLEMRERQAEQVHAKIVTERYLKLSMTRDCLKDPPKFSQCKALNCQDEALELMDRLEACTLLKRHYVNTSDEDGPRVRKGPFLSLSSLELDDLSVALHISETEPYLLELLVNQ